MEGVVLASPSDLPQLPMPTCKFPLGARGCRSGGGDKKNKKISYLIIIVHGITQRANRWTCRRRFSHENERQVGWRWDETRLHHSSSYCQSLRTSSVDVTVTWFIIKQQQLAADENVYNGSGRVAGALSSIYLFVYCYISWPLIGRAVTRLRRVTSFWDIAAVWSLLDNTQLPFK